MSYDELTSDKKTEYERRATQLVDDGKLDGFADDIGEAARKLYEYETKYGIQL